MIVKSKRIEGMSPVEFDLPCTGSCCNLKCWCLRDCILRYNLLISIPPVYDHTPSLAIQYLD